MVRSFKVNIIYIRKWKEITLHIRQFSLLEITDIEIGAIKGFEAPEQTSD